MRDNDSYINTELKTNKKEKKTLMYSQLFNYNLMGRDPMMRSVEVTAAVMAGSEHKSRTYKKWLTVLFLIICILFTAIALRHPVTAMVSKFYKEHHRVRMAMNEPDAISLNLDDIKSIEKGQKMQEGYYKWESYDTWSDIPFKNVTKDFAKDNEYFSYSKFTLGAYEEDNEKGIGMVSTYVTDNATNTIYQLKGFFKIADFTSENITLVDMDRKANFAYKSDCGIKAYFVRNGSYENATNYHVYFMIDGILFEMKIAANDHTIETMQLLLDKLIG